MSSYTRPNYEPRGYNPNGYFHNPIHPYDYANWGYIILYLVIILGSLILNTLFILVVKKNKNLHRTAHFLLATLAVRDLIVTILVVPFVIDSQVCINLIIFVFFFVWHLLRFS